MADRKKYFAEYYEKHKTKLNKRSKAWFKAKLKELGPEKFKEWKKIENDKFRKKKKNKKTPKCRLITVSVNCEIKEKLKNLKFQKKAC